MSTIPRWQRGLEDFDEVQSVPDLFDACWDFYAARGQADAGYGSQWRRAWRMFRDWEIEAVDLTPPVIVIWIRDWLIRDDCPGSSSSH